MVMEIKLWMVLGVLGFVVPLLVWMAKLGINRILAKLDEVIKSNSDFKTELVRQNGELTAVKDKLETHDERLNAHSSKIRELEINQAKRE